jgi:hypothetical protein
MDPFLLLEWLGDNPFNELCQFVGFIVCLTCLLFSWIPALEKQKNYSPRLLLLALFTLALKHFLPQLDALVYYLANNVGMSGVSVVSSLVTSFLDRVIWLPCYVAPSVIAWKCHQPRKNLIVAINCFGFLPPMWIIALAMACAKPRAQTQVADAPSS